MTALVNAPQYEVQNAERAVWSEALKEPDVL
jgi:hypothetical protein